MERFLLLFGKVLLTYAITMQCILREVVIASACCFYDIWDTRWEVLHRIARNIMEITEWNAVKYWQMPSTTHWSYVCDTTSDFRTLQQSTINAIWIYNNLGKKCGIFILHIEKFPLDKQWQIRRPSAKWYRKRIYLYIPMYQGICVASNINIIIHATWH